MISDAQLLKILEVARLLVAAVGFWASLAIWLFFRGVPQPSQLIVLVRQMFGSVAGVLFVASMANLARVAYGTEVFAGQPLVQMVVGLLYAMMTGTAVRFYWQLTKR